MNFMDGSKAKMSQYSKDQSHVQNKDYFKNNFMTWDNTLRWGPPQRRSLPSRGPDFGNDPHPSHQRVLSFIKVTILPSSHLQSEKESNQRFELWSHHQSFFTSSAIFFGGRRGHCIFVLGSLLFLSWCFSLNWISLSILHIKVHFIWGEDIPFKGSLLTTCPYKVPLRWWMQEHGEFPKSHKVKMWEL